MLFVSRTSLIVLFALGTITSPSHAASHDFGSAVVDRIDADHLTIHWDKDGPVDVYVADSPDAVLDQARKIAEDDVNGRINVYGPTNPRLYFILKSQSDGSELRLAERLLALDHSSNLRDIGGYPSAEGRNVRWGRIYRSGAMPMLTKADMATLSQLHVEQVVDLRSTDEKDLAPVDWKAAGITNYRRSAYSMADMFKAMDASMTNLDMMQAYRAFPELMKPQLKIVFAGLADAGAPILYHCSAGQDRTGFVTAMILSALDVPRAVIYEDYLLSSQYRRPDFEISKEEIYKRAGNNPLAKQMQDAIANDGAHIFQVQRLVNGYGTPYLAAAFDEIEKNWGSVDVYLEKEIGLGPTEIAVLRSRYLQ